MSNTIRLSVPMTGGALLAAPRQIWLATLGAAAMSREWAEKEAGTMFRSLVKEGSSVESRAIRLVGNRVETSVKRASALARGARDGVKASVESLASVASSLARKVPAIRARIDVESAGPQRKRAVKSVKPAKNAARTRTASTRRTKSRTQK